MRQRIRSEAGQAILEFAVILPVFLLVGFGLADVVWALEKVSGLEYIVNEVARCEAINGIICTFAPNTPATYAHMLADNIKMDVSRMTIQPSGGASPNCDGSTCSITISYRIQPLGVYFPVTTITRNGTAAQAPVPPPPGP